MSTSNSESTFVRENDIPIDHWDDPVHGRVSWRTLISADRTPTDSIVCGIAYFDKGGELKGHHHAPSEIVHVLSGSGKATIDGVEQIMARGDTFFVPGGKVHTFQADDEGMSLLYTFGVDDFNEVEYNFLAES